MSSLKQARALVERAKAAANVNEKVALLDQAIAILEAATASSSAALTWQQKDVLSLFREWGARPGQDVPPNSLATKWGTRAPLADMWAALDALEAAGLVQRNASDTAYSLTEAGFDRGNA
jgi:DNA-binding MarR family transcriptional regulator